MSRPADDTDPPESPCIDICAVDPDGCCVGCYRSLDEIAQWSAASDELKQEILKRCAQRKLQAQTNSER